MSNDQAGDMPVKFRIHSVSYNPPMVGEGHLEPKGRLLNLDCQHALWYFLRCAHHAHQTIPTQITTDDDEDGRADLKALAESVAGIYNTSLSLMFDPEMWRRAQAEAAESKLNIIKPIRDFIASGGQQFRYLDRDADSHNGSIL